MTADSADGCTENRFPETATPQSGAGSDWPSSIRILSPLRLGSLKVEFSSGVLVQRLLDLGESDPF